MNICCLFTFTFFINISIYNSAIAQKESLPESIPANYIKQYFLNEEGVATHLYTGKEYVGYEKTIKGDPFFATSEMEGNSLFYDGSLYENVPLLFDIVSNQIIINRYHDNLKIKLLSEKIKYFTLAGHRFENVDMAQKDGTIANGIYDLVVDGKIMVFVKRSKRIVNSMKAEEPPKFVEDDEFFIQNGNTFYPVEGNSSLLQALSDKKNLIKIFIRKNKFKFKKNIEKEIIMTAAYYNTLKI